MKVPTSGKPCPAATYTITIANQAVGANSSFSSVAQDINNASPTNAVLVCSARAELPKTAGGAHGRLSAYLSAENKFIVTLDNASAAALVATAADIIVDVIALEVSP